MNFNPEDRSWEIRQLGFSDSETKEIHAACESAKQKGYELSPEILAKVMLRSGTDSQETVRQYVAGIERKYSQIESAIKSKQVLEIYTHGGNREVCPHVLGYSGGTACLTFYQIGGHAKYHPVGWMTVCVEHIVHVSVSSAVWITPADYETSPKAKEIKDRRVWI